MKHIIFTEEAPVPFGNYSQAVKVNKTVYCSGQIGADPKTRELISEDFNEQAEQVFKNLQAVARAAGGTMQDFVKLTVYLTDFGDSLGFNDIMAKYIEAPYPARARIQVSRLPKDALLEIEGVMVLE